MKIRILSICVLFCICVSCISLKSSSTSPGQEAAAMLPSQTPDSASQAVLAARDDWALSPHAAAYDLGKGPNTYCARCHSPQNWDVNAKIDPPPNCVSCKFAFEDSPRIAVGNPLISEDDWKGIGCEVCHRAKNGVIDSAIAWYNQETSYYETVASSTELCEKCHTDTQALKYKMDFGAGAHSEYTCTGCHQPHSVEASCRSEGCHPEVSFNEESNPDYPGHTIFHESVECIACHDATGLEVGPLDEQEIWTVFRTTELLGRTNTTPYVSHNITKEVSCERCHFAENPWDIKASVME